jgi:DNA-binding HxlR family transcriptional regulator
MNTKPKRALSGCPIDYAVSVLGDSWSLLIIRDIAIKGAKTYAELLDGWEGISTNILAQRLKHLEERGVITKRKNPANWRSFVYELTPKGRDLAPLLAELILWGGKYNEAEKPMTGTYTSVQSDRHEFESKISGEGCDQL